MVGSRVLVGVVMLRSVPKSIPLVGASVGLPAFGAGVDETIGVVVTTMLVSLAVADSELVASVREIVVARVASVAVALGFGRFVLFAATAVPAPRTLVGVSTAAPVSAELAVGVWV